MRDIDVVAYGTLKEGWGNPCRLPDEALIGSGLTAEKFLLATGGFPKIIEMHTAVERGIPQETIDAYAGHLSVSRWRVTEEEFARLDRYEGWPNFYSRKLTPITSTDSPTPTQSWIYIAEGAGEQCFKPEEFFALGVKPIEGVITWY